MELLIYGCRCFLIIKRVFRFLVHPRKENKQYKLDLHQIQKISVYIHAANGKVVWLPREELKVADQLNKSLVEEGACSEFMNQYWQLKQLRRFSTRRHVPETVRVLVLLPKELDQEIVKYTKEGKVPYLCALKFLGCYPRIPSVECFQGDETTKAQMLESVDLFQKIGDKLQAYISISLLPIISCDDNDNDDVANLPLSFALEALSCNRCLTDWSVEKSVHKLIHIFCLKELKEPLATIRLLASRTSTEHLEKLSLQIAENGQVVKLTALLLVAWTKLVTERCHDNVECCPIAKCIQKQLQALSSSDQDMTAPCRSKLVKLESAWKMLKLLEKSYHNIGIHHAFKSDFMYYNGRAIKVVGNDEVPYNLHSILRVVGPEDLCCDDIECLMPRPEPKRKAWLDRSLQTYSGKTAVYTPKSLSNPNFICGQRTLTTTAQKSFRCFLPTARTCAHLLSIARRSLK